MGVIEIICGVLLILVSICIIISVAMQESSKNGMSALGGASSTDSYFGNNKSRTFNAMLVRFTRILAIVFFVVIIALNIVNVFVK